MRPSLSRAYWSLFLAMVVLHVPCRVSRLVALVQGGEWGEVRVPLLLLKLPLFLGIDLVGAAIASGFAVALAGPLTRLPGKTPALLIEGAVIALVGFYVPVSGFVRQVLGTPMDLVALQYLFGGQESSEGLVSQALRDSIAMYLTPGRLATVAGSILLGLGTWGWLRRKAFVPSRAGRRAWVAAVLIGGAVSGLLAPALSSGRLLGSRVMTWEQERSEVTDLLGSLATLLRERWAGNDDPGTLSFFFESPLPAMLAQPEAPLAGIRAGRKSLVLVVLESVPAKALEGPDARGLSAFRDLADRGVSFRAHYTPWPQTFKSFFSVLCSEQPWPGDRPESDLRFLGVCPDGLLEVLRREGWRTAVFLSGDGRFERLREFLERQRPEVLFDMTDMPGREGAWRNSWGLDESVTVRAILDQVPRLASDPERPFAVLYNLAVGHHPYDFPGFPGKATGTAEDHARAVAYVDGVLRGLLQGLRDLGVGDDLLVVVLSDHGGGFGEHPGGAGHGPRVFEEHVRVPLLLAGPGLPPGRVVEDPTSHQDLAPTLASVLGIPVPWTWKGRDLTRDQALRPVFFAGRMPVRPLGVRSGRWKWVQQYEEDEVLFDLEADPGETQDLRAQHPDVAEDLKAAALAWRRHGRWLLEHYREAWEAEAARRGLP